METFAALIDLWPTAEALGGDIGQPGVKVRAWKRRNAIPPGYWPKVVASAEARGIAGVTADQLARLAERGMNSSREAAA